MSLALGTAEVRRKPGNEGQIVLVAGERIQITRPILVHYRQDGDGDYVATAFDAKYEVIDPELKQALIALQEYMELDFIDLARFAREGKLTAGARALHERLSAHFKEL